MESVNLPKACGLKSQAWPMFCLTLRNNVKYEFTQGMWFEEPGMTKVLFNT